MARNEQTAARAPGLEDVLEGTELAAARALLASEPGPVDIGTLLRRPPNRYVTPGPLGRLADLPIGQEVSAVVRVDQVTDRRMRNRPGSILTASVSDDTGRLELTFFLPSAHLVGYHRSRLRPGVRIHVSGVVGEHDRARQIIHPEYLVLDEQHTLSEASRPVPVYPQRTVPGRKRPISRHAMPRAFATALARASELPEVVPPEVLKREGLVSLPEALSLVHAPRTMADPPRGLAYLAFEEAFVMQTIFAQRRAADELTPAPALTADGPRQMLLRERLPFTLTPGQEEVSAQIAERIGRDMPTSALLQGDVGSGKTVLALLAMLRAVDSGQQAALLAPTEVLAEQHHRTLMELLGGLGRAGRLDAEEHATRVRLLTGSQRTQDRRESLLDITSGEAGLIVGTHALLTESVGFHSLGLVVIDEQHRFGVDHRRRLRTRGSQGRSPHVIVMTATPIPRSAALAMVGDLDVLTLRDMPATRAGTGTFVVPESSSAYLERMHARVAEEIASGRQGFVVCPRISEAEEPAVDPEDPGSVPAFPPRGVEETLERLRDDPRFAQARIDMLHGRLSAEEKQEVMARMVSGDIDILVATTVIEVGVDVPNASAMVILDAERFGVSQLHQLRGRVGRGEHPGVVFLDTRAETDSPAVAHLEAIASTEDGFELARLDLERRGVGDLVGTEQSGLRRTLRHLDVLRDADVIESARTEAIAVVAADPDLDAHPGLAEAISMRLRDDDPDVERT